MERKLAPWSRPVNILDKDADQQIAENGRQAKLLHDYGYHQWNQAAYQFLILAKWGMPGVVLAKLISKLKELNEK